MNKIILTQHVKERRTKGFLPEESLRVFADYLINENELKSKEDGAYKFRRGGTCAIITKEKDKFIFITLYGPSKWIVDSDDYSGFSCHKQTEERVKLSKERSRHKQQFILQSKFNSYPFIDLLRYDGKHIQTNRVNTWKKLFLS